MNVLSRVLRAVLTLIAGAATMAAASPPSVDRPVPQPLTDCYKRCLSPAIVRSVMPTLSVKVSGTAGYFLYTDFEVRLAPSPHATVVASVQRLGPVSSPGFSRWQVPSLSADTPYFWRARTTNEVGVRGPWTRWQAMIIDTTPPEVPAVSSEEYPEGQWGAELGTEGTFHFSSESFDVVEFVSYIDPDPWTTTPAAGTSPRTASVTMTPKRDFVNVLNVYALDAAGNRSETYAYQFYVTPPPPRFAHWTLDDTAADSGNLGADGTLEGAVAFGPGYVGGSNGAVFSGGRIATATTVLDPTKSFTVMAWVNLADLAGGTVASQDGFRLYAGDGTWCAALGAETACVGEALTDQWMHVAARYDAITGTLAVFLNGDPYSCGGETTEVTTIGGLASGSFAIGEGSLGSIDDVLAHQRALAGVEICQHASW